MRDRLIDGLLTAALTTVAGPFLGSLLVWLFGFVFLVALTVQVALVFSVGAWWLALADVFGFAWRATLLAGAVQGLIYILVGRFALVLEVAIAVLPAVEIYTRTLKASPYGDSPFWFWYAVSLGGCILCHVLASELVWQRDD